MSRWAERIGRFFGQPAAVGDLGRGVSVAALVPPGAAYVTAGLVIVLRDANAFLGGPAGSRPYGRDLGWVPDVDGERQEVALMALSGSWLSVHGPDGPRWSAPAAEVVELDGHRRSGFVVLARNGQGLAVGTQTPVETPPGCSWRTVAGVTNLFSGWDRELAPFGARVLW